MTTESTIPTAADLWTLLQEQQVQWSEQQALLQEQQACTRQQSAEIDRLKAELDQHRLEQLAPSGRADETQGSKRSKRQRVSRAGLLKAAALGAAGLAGVGALGGTQEAAAAGTDGDVGLGVINTTGANNSANNETTILAASGMTGTAVFRADAYNGGVNTANIDGVQGAGSGSYSGVAGWGGPSGGEGIVGFGGGTTGSGVVGLAADATNPGSSLGVGVYGISGSEYGVHGASTSSPGVYGASSSSYGVHGTSDSVAGVYGDSSSGVGVSGDSTSGTGVFGQSTSGYAVLGRSSSSYGVLGESSSGMGVVGSGPNSIDLAATGSGRLWLLPRGVAGGPTSGSHLQGEQIVDSQGVLQVCTLSGTPGTWVPLMHGNSNDGSNNALLTKVSTQQYTLANSDGVTWMDLDTTNLALTITPRQNSLAIISGNSDLWTSQAGYNQDLGIYISGGSYPTTAGQPEAWKESGGFAGTYSPNAAFVQTVQPLIAGTAYTIKLQWKTNKSASGATIWAGAGPIGGKFSPTRLVVLLVPSP